MNKRTDNPVSGMRSSWTPIKWNQILEGLRNGASRPAACANVQIPYMTFVSWIAKDTEECNQLRAEVEDAERVAEYRATDVIVSSWDLPDKRIATQNAQWFLERRYPQLWGQMDMRKLTTDQLLGLYRMMSGDRDDEKPLSIQELQRKKLVATVEANEATGEVVEVADA